jgi:hypothetical protein
MSLPESSTEPARVIDFPDYYRNKVESAFPEGACVQIHDQVHRLDLNNRMATVLGRDGLRTLVIKAAGDTLSLADNQLKVVELGPGSKVTIVGLKSAVQHNGQIGTILKFSDDRWNVGIQEENGNTTAISVKPVNVVFTPHAQEGKGNTGDGSNHVFPMQGNFRRPRKENTPNRTLTRQAPMQLMVLDLAVALNPQEPILKRCGSLRKIIFTSPGFACKAIAVLGLVSADQRFSGRGFIAQDHLEGQRLADILTQGKCDGELRAVDLHNPELSGLTDRCMVIADRHSTAAHLIAIIDDNVGGIKDSMRSLFAHQAQIQVLQQAQQAHEAQQAEQAQQSQQALQQGLKQAQEENSNQPVMTGENAEDSTMSMTEQQ